MRDPLSRNTSADIICHDSAALGDVDLLFDEFTDSLTQVVEALRQPPNPVSVTPESEPDAKIKLTRLNSDSLKPQNY